MTGNVSKWLFIALPIPDQVRSAIAAYNLPNSVRAVPKKNMHITLRFLGDVAVEKIPSIRQAMSTISLKSFSLATSVLGMFPQGVLWYGFERNDALIQCKSQLDNALSSIGMARDTHQFIPHVTLARGSNSDIAACMKTTEWNESIHFQVKALTLYDSELIADGGRRYIPLFQQELN